MKRKEKRKAREYLNYVLMELKNHYSELLYPLSVLKFEEAPEGWKVERIATDGAIIYYNPEGILLHSKELVMTEIIHILLHGLLGHFLIKNDYEQCIVRDLVMDIQVNYLLARLGGVADMKGRHSAFDADKMVQGNYSMSSYYYLLAGNEEISKLKYYQRIAQVDNHEMWDRDMTKLHGEKVRKIWGDIQAVVLGEENVKGGENGEEAMEAIISTLIGKGAGDNQTCFSVGKGSGKNYKELLKELFRMREVNKEEPDSIDYMFYQYGLELYGDVPLIEPLEITERPIFHRLAIAVDVSGSCTYGEVMEKFWGETYDCISQLRGEHGDGEVLIFQCDEAIQDEKRLRLEEFDERPARIDVKGCGGTDFVPVFERIKALAEEGAKVDVLIYLTDGEGFYPKERPNYPVYFVLPKENINVRYFPGSMPKWIQKICLE